MSRKKGILSYVVLAVGGLLMISGMALIVTYILEAVIARIGEPDQSLLFWYLPFLLFGVIATLAGFRMTSWGLSRTSNTRTRPASSTDQEH